MRRASKRKDTTVLGLASKVLIQLRLGRKMLRRRLSLREDEPIFWVVSTFKALDLIDTAFVGNIFASFADIDLVPTFQVWLSPCRWD